MDLSTAGVAGKETNSESWRIREGNDTNLRSEATMHDTTARVGAQRRKSLVIEARDLTKTYGRGESRVEAVAGVSLGVASGEWLSVVGPSGSGKSTLMNLLGLLDRPTSGSYALGGREVSKLRGGELARARRKLVGFVFQSYNLLSRRTARENIELPMIYAGVGRRERKRRATEALERVGLTERARHKPPELSGGQQQRVAIARALINDPALLLADEPTGNLDSVSSEDIMSLFQELNSSGTTLIVVTHDASVATRADRTVEMRDGKIFAGGEPDRRDGSGEGP
jgi:putative ABC transport system ATP-binding protein